MSFLGDLFESVVEGSLETREDGSVLFYPYAWSRTAYRLTDERKQERVRSSMRRFHVAAIGGAGTLSGILASSLTPLQFLAFVLPALMAISFLAHQVLIRRLVGDCEQVEATLSFTDRFRRQAEAMGAAKAWLLAGTNLAIFLSLLFLSWASVPIREGWIVLGLSVFGVTTVGGAAQLYYSRRASTESK